jgi:hypothetical protein
MFFWREGAKNGGTLLDKKHTNMKKIVAFSKCLSASILIMLAITLYSCQDDLLTSDEEPEEGQPATVSLNICLPPMDVQTRAHTDAEESYVGTIWVGVFRANDGVCVYNNFFDPPTETSSTYDKLYSVGLFTISDDDLSGKVRIVAVANAERYMGIDASQKNEHGMVSKQTLSDLLSNVTTWKQFNSVTLTRNSTTDVSLTTNALLMSGYYADSIPKTYAYADNIPTVDIPPCTSGGQTTLPGAIYLRHVISYNKFNITHNENINLTLETWRVMNIPYCSYILEKDGNACTSVVNGNNPGLESHLFTVDEDNKNARGFEFYQLENKHTAVAYSPLTKDADGNVTDYIGIDSTAADPYQCREREFKNSDGSNSGTYKSLMSFNLASLPDNQASYVEITAELDYYYNAKYKDNPEQAEPEAFGASANQIHRKANVTYTIHLGYCEGNNKYEKANDFNCRRNTRYTYNVTINGVNKIVVEAKKEGELQPGSEGKVVDMTADPVVMDAHYNVFNIQLTDEERENLRWFINAPYAGRSWIYESQDGGIKEFDTNSECYTWIKFRPTTEKDVLAKYCDANDPNLSLSSLWSLDDLKDVSGHPNDLDQNNDPKGKWYTVFIDEYVYHSDPDGGNKESGNEVLWGNYVNQDDRRIDFYNEKMFPSDDSESFYIPAIYSFSQRSIQTHYAEDAQLGESAFGVEHINEVYGLNFYEGEQGSRTLDKYNGRYVSKDKFAGKSWSNWVSFTEPGTVPAAQNNGWNDLSIDEKNYPVPMMVSTSTANQTDNLYLSSSTKGYASGAGCLNRNRDLNGNGIIDVDELRWYVPSSEEYIQIAIGQTELPSPLINFIEHFQDEFSNLPSSWTDYKDKRLQLQYHYWTSDDRYFFAEEGMSMGEGQFIIHNYVAQTVCYQVRCIRQLGLTPSTEPTRTGDFQYASSFVDASDNDHNYIESKYFTANSMRPATVSYLTPHDPSSIISMPPKKFEVAKDVCRNITSTDKLWVATAQGYLRNPNNLNDAYSGLTGERNWYTSCLKNSICSQYTQEENQADLGKWRVPNIRELAMMRTLGYLSATAEDAGLSHSRKGGYYISCTHDYFQSPAWSTVGTSDFVYRFYGKRGDDGSLARNMFTGSEDNTYHDIHLKCVRDVVDTSTNH